MSIVAKMLEDLVIQHGISEVLSELSDICNDKADLTTDEQVSDQWNSIAGQLSTIAEETEHLSTE